MKAAREWYIPDSRGKVRFLSHSLPFTKSTFFFGIKSTYYTANISFKLMDMYYFKSSTICVCFLLHPQFGFSTSLLDDFQLLSLHT